MWSTPCINFIENIQQQKLYTTMNCESIASYITKNIRTGKKRKTQSMNNTTTSIAKRPKVIVHSFRDAITKNTAPLYHENPLLTRVFLFLTPSSWLNLAMSCKCFYKIWQQNKNITIQYSYVNECKQYAHNFHKNVLQTQTKDVVDFIKSVDIMPAFMGSIQDYLVQSAAYTVVYRIGNKPIYLLGFGCSVHTYCAYRYNHITVPLVSFKSSTGNVAVNVLGAKQLCQLLSYKYTDIFYFLGMLHVSIVGLKLPNLWVEKRIGFGSRMLFDDWLDQRLEFIYNYLDVENEK